MQTHQLDARIGRMLDELRRLTVRVSLPVEGIRIARDGEAQSAPFENGAVWGADGQWWDFSFSVIVPETFQSRVALKIRTGRETGWEAINPQFLARVNGRIEQAFDTRHTSMTLQKRAKPGQRFDVALKGYAAPTPENSPFPILSIALEDIDEPLQQLVYDIAVPHEAALLISEGERERESTLETLARALDLLDLRTPHSPAFDASVQAARQYLKEAYYDVRASLPPIAQADCVGHTHIDVAWLWDLYQTRHKAVRSFSTVLKLMELYPEYRFMSSQAALYNMVKQDAPDLFTRIQEAVKAGRWEVEGGMWVEADCNLASGESLARQFLYGQAFFQREFGQRSRILWLPDVFGYSAALPQILKLSGIDYFMTTKLSWSEFNLSPYDTFLWVGLDGSKVLTHFSPARDFVGGSSTGHETHAGLPYFTTYNALLQPKQIAGGWQRFQQKGLDDHILISYGYGDGGGGPTEWMLENARRMAVPQPATPVVRQAHARPFFEALEQRVMGDPRLPKWSGELYLEYHRGTYTAMARNKRSNRKIELTLRDVELWSAAAAQYMGLPYPTEALNAIWEDVLTLQFHDILPGSSIKKVYEDSKVTYSQRFLELEALKARAVGALSQGVAGDVLAFNSLSHARDDVIWFDAPEDVTALRNAAGALFPAQHAMGRTCAFIREMQPMAVTPLWFSKEPIQAESVQADQNGFETPFFSGSFDEAMGISSLIEKKTNRQIVKPGQALNRIVCYENKPHNYDAWDINAYYSRRFWEVDGIESVEIMAVGPVLALLRITRRYMNSTIAQDITLYHDLGRIDFDTTADWKEVQYLLKAHFPVDVFYNDATYDIQYGNLRRPTHRNTSWDAARFEVCAHKWADVSEDGFGVSLLNDCKYGHSIDENSMALTLLKSSTYPNPDADQEVHRFAYSLMPHAEGWREAGTTEMAYQFNIPVTVCPGAGGGGGALPTFAKVDAPNILIETVKQTQDGNGVVIRLYECHGRRTNAALALGFKPNSAMVCNILEEKLEDAAVNGRQIDFTLKPYEIKSFRVGQ